MIKNFILFLIHKQNRQLILATLSLFLTGTVIFHYAEGWRWFDAFYYCVITLSTVGYGDLVPKTDLGKGLTMIYIISGIGLFLAFIQGYFDFLKERQIEKEKEKLAKSGKKKKS